MSKSKPTTRNPWAWISSLYYAEGIPYVIVMTVAVIMYKRMGISNTDIALYTSWLYLPWVIKPLWSPIVDIFKTKRAWIVVMQLIIGAGLAGVALTIPLPNFFQYTLAFFWLLAFSSATHDIAADGFYMLGLSKHDQALYIGVRSTFYRIAMITGQGLLIILAGYFESTTGLPSLETKISATTSSSYSYNLPPDSINIVSTSNNLEIIQGPDQLNIPIKQISKSEADSLIKQYRESNIKNGFTLREIGINKGGQDDSNLSSFEIFIKNTFGKAEEKTRINDAVGNIGVIYFHLSNSPEVGEEIVVTFGGKSSAENISLVEGTRFTFNEQNWNKPAFAVFQLDPKLKSSLTTSFIARAGNIHLSWIITFTILAGLFIVFFIYHKFMLPYPVDDKPASSNGGKSIIQEFIRTFILFFKKEKMGIVIAFLLLYRLGESQLVKLASPFLLDSREVGGLGLTTSEVGLVYGTIGILALTLGGLLGGYVASKHGLKKWLLIMLVAINVPNTVYIYLSYVLPESFFIVNLCVAVEQFGYGFGFTAYMLYMIYASEGEHKTAHFAITTGFMALGMMIPGMISGWLQELIGYQHFFIWVVIATIPAFIITYFLPLDPNYGKKES